MTPSGRLSPRSSDQIRRASSPRRLATHDEAVARQRELDTWCRFDGYLFETFWELQHEAEDALLGSGDGLLGRLCDTSVLAESYPTLLPESEPVPEDFVPGSPWG